MNTAQRAARTGSDADCHVLMPNMAYACGANILTVKGDSVFSAVAGWDRVTCEGCRELGRIAIWRASRRQQGHDADACECNGCRHGRKILGNIEPVDLLDLL